MTEFEPPIPHQRFLLLEGDGIQFLTSDHREVLCKVASMMAGGRSIEATVLIDPSILDPIEPQSLPFINLVGKTPNEILQMRRDISSQRDELESSYEDLDSGFCEGLANLSQLQPEQGIAAFEALASSKVEDERVTAATCIYRLVATAPEAAFRIWEMLIRDVCYTVVDVAKESLDIAIAKQMIALDDGLRLLQAYSATD